MSEPIVQPVGDSYFVAWGDGLIFEFHHLTAHRDGLASELAITQDGFEIYWGRLTLASTVARTAVVKHATEAKAGLPWRRLVDEACHRVVRATRQGAPATPLEPEAPAAARWLVDGLIPVGETTVVFGDGGSGKSLFALGFAVHALLGHRFGPWPIQPITKVLYLDWESSRPDHAQRLWGLTRALEAIPEGSLLYRPMVRPVAEEQSELRALVAQHQVDLVVADSLGPACGAEPETAGAATAALTALRSCAPATRLVIAHVSKAEADRSKGHARPFGSVYVYNLARSVIEAKRQDSTEEQEFTLTLTHTKANSGPRRPQTALRWLFDPEGYIHVRTGEPDLARASQSTQILAELRGGPQSAADLADSLDSTRGSVSKELSRLAKRGKVVDISAATPGRGHKALWALRDNVRHEPE